MVVAATLAILVTLAARDMTTSATVIDDARATRAATAAVRALGGRLGATLTDNSVWDDGYTQILSDKGKAFAASTWGKSTDGNPLYDAAVVLTPQHAVLTSYKNGAEFDAQTFFGASLLEMAGAAEKSGRLPAISFVNTPDGLAMIAAGAIQPFTRSTTDLGPFSTLVFAKFLSVEALGQIEQMFDLNDLQLAAAPNPSLLGIPLTGVDGGTLAYLQWPSRNPGAMIYARSRWYLVIAAIVLATFLAAVLVTGAVTVRMQQRSIHRAHRKATHDALSGLLNRAGFLVELDRSMAAGRAGRLHLINLDGFKGVNDAWGQTVGDQVITLVAARIKALLPRHGFLARLGGDEFAVVTDWDTEPSLAEAIIASLAKPFLIGGRTIGIGASIGRVRSIDGLSDGLELLRCAEMALYAAKQSGRGRAVDYTADLDRDRELIAELEDKLRQAIAANEIHVAYQPLVDARTGRLRGVEALAQWAPRTGSISPEVFIPIAERSGLIDQLGMQVLQTAIDQAKKWGGLGVSVNVSPIQLRNPNFAADVAKVVQAKRFEPSLLTLEITEGVLMSNPDQARRAIEVLRYTGVKFALDDFGCGYASIGALRAFGFDRMKIDRSLVSAMDSPGGADVLAATISLARALNIPVTAEGVETQAQADALALSGCDQLQGFLIGRPMSAEAIAALLASSPPAFPTDAGQRNDQGLPSSLAALITSRFAR